MAEQALRILVVLPLYGGSLPIGEYCASALRQLGHSVRIFEAQKLYPAYLGLKQLDMTPGRIAAQENSFLKFVSQTVWSMAQEQKPQLVLAMAQAPLDKNVLQRMRQAGMRTVMWFVEDYRVFNYWRLYATLYDAFAIIQKEPFSSELAAIGQNHVLYLPLAALPSFHRKLELGAAEKKEYGSAISFLGAGYPNRRLAFRPLAGKDFKIWGSDWEGEGILAGNVQRGGQRIDASESVKIYNASKINLNLHSSLDSDNLVSHGDFVNPRTFELAGMGLFQLVDRRSLMDELFAPGELAIFDSLEDFYRKIDYYLEHPEEREKIAQAGQERVLRDHTYEKRMETLLTYMEKTFGAWPSEKSAANNAHPELRKYIEESIPRLGLAPDAPFDDVVARLRSQSGELTSVEATILFMDEWRKQYGFPKETPDAKKDD